MPAAQNATTKLENLPRCPGCGIRPAVGGAVPAGVSISDVQRNADSTIPFRRGSRLPEDPGPLLRPPPGAAGAVTVTVTAPVIPRLGSSTLSVWLPSAIRVAPAAK